MTTLSTDFYLSHSTVRYSMELKLVQNLEKMEQRTRLSLFLDLCNGVWAGRGRIKGSLGQKYILGQEIICLLSFILGSNMISLSKELTGSLSPGVHGWFGILFRKTIFRKNGLYILKIMAKQSCLILSNRPWAESLIKIFKMKTCM